MITQNYCSFEVAKLLKEKGFNEWCNLVYGTGIRYRGKNLSFDEELELKNEGRGSKIEYIPGGSLYKSYNRNQERWMNDESYSCPSCSMVIKWLRENYDYHITIEVMKDEDGITRWFFKIFSVQSGNLCYVSGENRGENGEYDSYDDAEMSALKYVLENLI